jgi:hypothetical protein
MSGVPTEIDTEWEDPLPQSLVQPRYYLSPLSDRTKAVVILLHGRGENIDDMVGVFLPTFAKRYGGVEGVKDDLSSSVSPITLLGLEARDNAWYPQGPVRSALDAKINGPYCYSALELLRKTILRLTVESDHPVPLSNIVLVGFSQGAILLNAYLLAALEYGNDKRAPAIPLPAHLFSLAGTLLGIKPAFPYRPAFGSDEEKVLHERDQEKERMQSSNVSQPDTITLHLLCGDQDRYFSEAEIHETARHFLQAKEEQIEQGNSIAQRIRVGVGMEKGAGHVVTERMIAAVAQAIDQTCGTLD